jgi:hypothetical protein
VKTTTAGGSVEKVLQFFLATPQRRLVSLNIVDRGGSRCLLSGHVPAPFEIGRLGRHDLGAFTPDPGRSLGAGSGALDEAAAAFGLADLGFLGSRFPRL